MNERSDAIVMFGATGDLAKRSLFPALHQLAGRGRLAIPVIGVARSDWSDDDLRRHARDGIASFAPDGIDEHVWSELGPRIRFVRGDYSDPDTYDRLSDLLAQLGACRPLVYLAIPPSVFDDVIGGLAKAGMCDGGRIVLEKPFGRDLASSRRLNELVLQGFDESRVFRIDHFLGKESVLDLLVFRFDNLLLEPLWNRHYIASIQITMAEEIGVGTRGAFYEEVGALRDVVQNHLLQLLAVVAMEAPTSSDAEALRDEKGKLLRAVRTVDPGSVVRGQYEGYRDEHGVAPDSQADSYVAMVLSIDNWRWAGVPILIRAGKRLATTTTQVLVEFQRPPMPLFHDPAEPPHPNHFCFRIKPDEEIALSVQIKRRGERLVSAPVELDYAYEPGHGPVEMAYERLLDDAMDGDQTLFARSDSIEEAWRIIQPVLDEPPPVIPYAPGSWGPPGAERLIPDGWHPL